MLRYSDATGCVEWLRPAGTTAARTARGRREPGSNGLAIDPTASSCCCASTATGASRGSASRSPCCSHRTRSAPSAEPRFETVCARYENSRFHSPNDLVVGRDGSIWFTDPPYGLRQGIEDPERELEFQGVYRRAPDGTVHLVERGIARPNGIGLSPDERTLYVADSNGKQARWWAFDVATDHTVGNRRLLCDPHADAARARRPGSCDGMAIAASGHLFATGPGGVWVLTPDGRHLGTILTTRRTANCTFGDPDRKSLYITADDLLLRIRLRVRGAD